MLCSVRSGLVLLLLGRRLCLLVVGCACRVRLRFLVFVVLVGLFVLWVFGSWCFYRGVFCVADICWDGFV